MMSNWTRQVALDLSGSMKDWSKPETTRLRYDEELDKAGCFRLVWVDQGLEQTRDYGMMRNWTRQDALDLSGSMKDWSKPETTRLRYDEKLDKAGCLSLVWVDQGLEQPRDYGMMRNWTRQDALDLSGSIKDWRNPETTVFQSEVELEETRFSHKLIKLVVVVVVVVGISMLIDTVPFVEILGNLVVVACLICHVQTMRHSEELIETDAYVEECSRLQLGTLSFAESTDVGFPPLNSNDIIICENAAEELVISCRDEIIIYEDATDCIVEVLPEDVDRSEAGLAMEAFHIVAMASLGWLLLGPSQLTLATPCLDKLSTTIYSWYGTGILPLVRNYFIIGALLALACWYWAANLQRAANLQWVWYWYSPAGTDLSHHWCLAGAHTLEAYWFNGAAMLVLSRLLAAGSWWVRAKNQTSPARDRHRAHCQSNNQEKRREARVKEASNSQTFPEENRRFQCHAHPLPLCVKLCDPHPFDPVSPVYKFIREVKSHDNDSVLKQQISPFADIVAWRNCQVGSSESGNSRTADCTLVLGVEVIRRSRGFKDLYKMAGVLDDEEMKNDDMYRDEVYGDIEGCCTLPVNTHPNTVFRAQGVPGSPSSFLPVMMWEEVSALISASMGPGVQNIGSAEGYCIFFGSILVLTSAYVIINVKPYLDTDDQAPFRWIFSGLIVHGAMVMMLHLIGQLFCKECSSPTKHPNFPRWLSMWLLVTLFILVLGIVIASKCRACATALRLLIHSSMFGGLGQYLHDVKWKSLLDTLQQELKCCGVEGPQDWRTTSWIPLDQFREESTTVSKYVEVDGRVLPPVLPWSCCNPSSDIPCLHDPLQQRHIAYLWDDRSEHILASIHPQGCLSAILSPVNYALVATIVFNALGFVLHVIVIVMCRYLYVSTRNSVFLGDPKCTAPGWLFGRGDFGYRWGATLEEIMLKDAGEEKDGNVEGFTHVKNEQGKGPGSVSKVLTLFRRNKPDVKSGDGRFKVRLSGFRKKHRQDDQTDKNKISTQDGLTNENKIPRQNDQPNKNKIPRRDDQTNKNKIPKQDDLANKNKMPKQDDQNNKNKMPRQDNQTNKNKILRQGYQTNKNKIPRQDGQTNQTKTVPSSKTKLPEDKKTEKEKPRMLSKEMGSAMLPPCSTLPYVALLVGLLSGVATQTTTNKIWDVVFDPEKVVDLNKDTVATVSFTTTDLTREDVDTGVVMVVADGNGWVANPEPPDKRFVLSNESVKGLSWSSSFNVTGNFLGYAILRLQLIGRDGVLVKESRPLQVTVVRGVRVIDTLFTFTVAILVSIIYINFGCALEWSIFKKTVKKPVGPAIGFCSQFLFMPLRSSPLPKDSPSSTILPKDSPSSALPPKDSPSSTLPPKDSPSFTLPPKDSPSSTLPPKDSPNSTLLP
uniref:Uncharacterized protein n=1 Tax=Timema douglasi TaxID=61478 RepID=A0A7R8VSF0_TIMDO|nr:unnamed protein product [Timema douglasi]